MIYVNETKKKDYNLKIKTYRFNLWCSRLLCIAFGGIFCILGIITIIACVSKNEYEPLGFGIPMLLFGPLFILMGIYLKKIFHTSIEKRKQKIAPVTRVTFEDNAFEVIVPFDPENSGLYRYSELTVTEYPEVWVLELSDGKWHTLNKCDMIEGSEEELFAFLSKRLGKRYIISEESIEEIIDEIIEETT